MPQMLVAHSCSNTQRTWPGTRRFDRNLKLTGAPATMLRASIVAGVVVHAQVWPHRLLLDWYDQMDCYVSAARAGAFGVGLGEFRLQFRQNLLARGPGETVLAGQSRALRASAGFYPTDDQ